MGDGGVNLEEAGKVLPYPAKVVRVFNKQNISFSIPLLETENLLQEAGQVFIIGPQEKIKFQEWRQRRLDKNLEVLGGADSVFARGYLDLLDWYPHLEEVDLMKPEELNLEVQQIFENTAGFFYAPEKDYPRLRIFFDAENSEKILRLLDVRPDSAASWAELMYGIDVDYLRKNPQLLNFFALFHEFGHAQYFIENYKNKSSADAPGKDYLYQVRNEIESLPLHLSPPAALAWVKQLDIDRYFSENKDFFGKMGITVLNAREKIPEFLAQKLLENDAQYRRIPTENYADNFSIRFITDAYDEMSPFEPRVAFEELFPKGRE